MIMNAWVSIRDDFDHSDPDNIAFFTNAIDAEVVNAGWKQENQGGRDWQLWSVFFREITTMDDAIDDLAANNPGMTKTLAAWFFDGLAYLPPDGGYAVYGNLLRYMPDVVDPADPGGPLIPATVLTDINLLAGQTARIF